MNDDDDKNLVPIIIITFAKPGERVVTRTAGECPMMEDKNGKEEDPTKEKEGSEK